MWLPQPPRPATTRERLDSYAAAWNARDWDRLRELYAPDVRLVDRRLIGWGELQGPDAIIEVIRGTSALAPDAQLDLDVLVSGERGAICRQTIRGHAAEGGGEFEVELFSVSKADDGLLTYLEIFDDTGFGAAYERFEEIGAVTEPERLAARYGRAHNAHDLDALRDCYTEDCEIVDHRSIGWETLRGIDAVMAMFSSWLETVPDLEDRVEVLASDDRHSALRVDGFGHAADGGGPLEYFLAMVITIRDGRCRRSELFDAGDEEAALARFEELRRADRPAAAPAEPGELLERWVAAYNARDRDALREIFAPDLRFADRRLVGWGEHEGPDAFLDILWGAFPLAPDLRMESAVPLAQGERAVVARYVSRGHLAAGGGELEVALVTLTLFENGRATAFEMFDGDDADAALARFEEIGAATEPERQYARLCRFVNARDWDGLSGCYAEDYEQVDRRTLGWERLRGRWSDTGDVPLWAELVPDLDFRFEALAGDEQTIAVRVGGYGHATAEAGGGAMEYVAIAVATIRDGLWRRAELFDADDESAALARFEELRRAGRPAAERATPRGLLERFVAAFNARDWDGCARRFRRRICVWSTGASSGGVSSRAVTRLSASLRGAVELAPDCSVERPSRSLSARSAAVGRFLDRGHLAAEGGGEFEIAFVSLVHSSQDGRVSYFEHFEFADTGRRSRASRRSARRPIPSASTPASGPRRNARDWDAVACLLRGRLRRGRSPDARVGGCQRCRRRRRRGVLPFVRRACARHGASLRGAGRRRAARGPRVQRLTATLRPRPAAERSRSRASSSSRWSKAASAGPSSSTSISATPPSPCWPSCAAARRRHRGHRLRASSSTSTRQRSTPATGTACARLYAPDVRLVDRRLVGWGELDGPDAVIEPIRGTAALAPDIHLDIDVLVVRGARGDLPPDGPRPLTRRRR